MRIRNVSHKGLRRFIDEDDRTGLPPATLEKIRNIVFVPAQHGAVDELKALQSWKAHQPTGDRMGTWSLTVTRNWRLTFRVAEEEIGDLDFGSDH